MLLLIVSTVGNEKSYLYYQIGYEIRMFTYILNIKITLLYFKISYYHFS